MKPPVEAPDVEADAARRIDPERVERRGELVAAPAHVRLGRLDLEWQLRIDEVARLPIESRPIADPDADLPAEEQRLGTGARFGKPPLDDELVEPNPGRTHAAHRSMVTDGASPGLTADQPARPNPGAHDGAAGGHARGQTRGMSAPTSLTQMQLLGVASETNVAEGYPRFALDGKPAGDRGPVPAAPRRRLPDALPGPRSPGPCGLLPRARPGVGADRQRPHPLASTRRPSPQTSSPARWQRLDGASRSSTR